MVLGASALTIAGGHFIAAFDAILSEFSSVSATGFNVYPKSVVVDSDGNSTGNIIDTDILDHVSFTGTLKSGVLASVVLTTGHKMTPGHRQFLWDIDGDKGSIHLESDQLDGALIQLLEPNL